MKSQSSQMLLAADDPPPVQVINPQGRSPFLLIGDHAGNRVPAALQPFGLSAEEMRRHIAWDRGTADLGEALSGALDAMFFRQTYSRLVIDCNRDPDAADAMPAISDGSVIPANGSLSAAERMGRVAAIHAPYQSAIGAELARRDVLGRATTLVSLHSFTPVMNGVTRPWHVGVLYSEGDTRFSTKLLDLLREEDDLCVGDNKPYAMDATDFTVPRHAFRSQRRYAEIEIRQDLLSTHMDVRAWATTIANHLTQVDADLVENQV